MATTIPYEPPQALSIVAGEADLIHRACNRDESAIRSIMKSNNSRLYRVARGILRNDSEAEDVVQETYLRAFTNLESFRGTSSLGTWLVRIAMNEALGRLRRQKPSVEWDSLPSGMLEAQIIQFPLSATSEDPEKSWHNARSIMSSSRLSMICRKPFASYSLLASSKA